MIEILEGLSEYKSIIVIIGFLATFIESFIPILPLMAIIIFNSYTFGLYLGYIISLLGSICASIVLYMIFNKFSNASYVKNVLKKNNVDRLSKFFKNQGFSAIFISYLCPFIPDFLVTITSGLIGFDFKKFLYGMILGKGIMFFIMSYLGEDFDKIFKDPIKIFIFILILIGFWYIGKVFNKKIDSKK